MFLQTDLILRDGRYVMVGKNPLEYQFWISDGTKDGTELVESFDATEFIDMDLAEASSGVLLINFNGRLGLLEMPEYVQPPSSTMEPTASPTDSPSRPDGSAATIVVFQSELLLITAGLLSSIYY